MRIGISSWAYSFPGGAGDIDRWCREAIAAGCDHLEIGGELVGAVTDEDAARFRECLDGYGLTRSVCGLFSAERDLASTSRDAREAGLEYARACVEFSARIGARVLVGAFGGAGGDGSGSRSERIGRLAEALTVIAGYAVPLGVVCGIEALNRYENDLITTVADSVAVVDAVDSPQLGVHLDLFHAGIEEEDVAQAIRAAGRRLVHLHAVSHRRRAPGEGTAQDWAAITEALVQAGYRGNAVMEIFRPGSAIARLARISDSQYDFDASIRNGVRFLRGVAAALA